MAPGAESTRREIMTIGLSLLCAVLIAVPLACLLASPFIIGVNIINRFPGYLKRKLGDTYGTYLSGIVHVIVFWGYIIYFDIAL